MHMFGSNEGQRFMHTRLTTYTLVWDQAPQWGKRKKQIGKISASEVSRVFSWGGGKGGGAGRHAFDTAVP